MHEVDRVHRHRHVRAPLAADDGELCEGAERERVGDLPPRLQVLPGEVAIDPPHDDLAQAVELADNIRQLTRLRVLRIDQAGVQLCCRWLHLGREASQLFSNLLHCRRGGRRRRERRRRGRRRRRRIRLSSSRIRHCC